MSVELAQLVEQTGPYLSAAVSAYGATVLTRAQDTAADATVKLGQRILQAVWRRRARPDQAALAVALEDAAGQQDPAASTELRQQIERAFREDGQLREEIAAMLPRAPRTVITASGERGVAAYHIDTVISGDNNSIQ